MVFDNLAVLGSESLLARGYLGFIRSSNLVHFSFRFALTLLSLGYDLLAMWICVARVTGVSFRHYADENQGTS